MNWENEKLIEVLGSGGIAVMPTDTLYGIVAKAQNKAVVQRIYKLRKRSPNKPCIILISSAKELTKFSVILSEEQRKAVRKYWSGPTSIILDCPDEKFAYLHRGTKTLAFRVPAPRALRILLKNAGPLIAPSANLEGLPPSQNINEAKKYFGDAVDLYVDGGELKGKASKVIKLHDDGSVDIIRE
jgi:L-threonylcarbamoyladenylate synthase